MQLRRMADASLALAERRADDLKDAVEKLGQQAPSERQLLALRFMGLVAPPPGSSRLVRVRGIATVIGVAVLLLAIGYGLAKLVALPFGGVGTIGAALLGVALVLAILAVLSLFGRRRMAKARERARPGSS